MKLFLITAFITLFTCNVFAQDVVSLLVNGKKIGERTVTDRPININLHKLNFKNVKAVSLLVKQAAANNVYKRTLQVSNETDSILYEVNESPKGRYKINPSALRSKILKQKIIKVYLAENPANSMMRILSKRTLLAEIHATSK